jgi:WASH complex subunit 7
LWFLFRHESNTTQALEVRSGVLLKGLSVALRVNYLLRSYLITHEIMQEPLSKSALLDVGSLIEILKSIEYTFIRKQSEIAMSFALSARHFAGEVLSAINPLSSKLDMSRKLDSTRQDLMGVISVLKGVLLSTDSWPYTRMAVVAIAADIILGAQGVAEKEAEKLKLMVKRLSCMSALLKSLRNACDTQFMFYHRNVFTHLVQHLYQHAIAPSRLHYLVGAFADGVRACNSVLHYNGDVRADFVVKYRSFITSCIKNGIINPLCRYTMVALISFTPPLHTR